MSRILEKLADQHEERIINVLYKLEEDIIKEVNRATKGQLISQRIAIQLAPKIRQAIENNFLNEADLIINEEYNKIAKEVLDTFGELPIPNKFKSLTEVNLSTINALKFQSYSGFEDIGERFIKVINDELYQSTIAGRPYEDMVSNIRSHINGVYKKSNQREINELVDFINENKYNAVRKLEVEEAVRKLHTQYASDRAGNNLRRYAGQIAHDSVMQFHGQFTIAKAKESGLTHFTYTGTLVRDSRDWCRGILGKTYTEKQIRELWNTRSWQGKANGDPFIVRGGYRCRHTWIPTDPSWSEETVDKLPEEPIVEQVPERTKLTNKSSITNPVKEKNINVISNTIVSDKLQKQITKNAKDERYFEQSRYRTSNVGKVTGVQNLDDEIASQLDVIMQELDDLAELYQVPKLRSVTISARRRALASMGDGNLTINPKYFNRKNVDDKTQRKFRDAFLGKGFYKREQELADNYTSFIDPSRLIKKENKANPDTWVRPHNAFYFFEEEMDRFRNIIYHEFGHQVHQMKNKRFYDDAPIEQAMLGKGINGGSTRYSTKNTKEWFAENFSLYHMNKKDLVDPKFIEFVEGEVL